MALIKEKVGKFLTVIDERNVFDLKNFYGLNINKQFMPTVADVSEVDASKYKVVRKSQFVFSGMQTGRDKCIRIGLYTGEEPILISPAYITFEIAAPEKILPEYFFMAFLSREKDRLGWFYSDGSIRANLDWERFCEIDIDVPDLTIQRKYVDIYRAMQENQRCYERGLDDLKRCCDAYIEKLKREVPAEKIGPYLTRKNERNWDGHIVKVMGLSTKKEFREAQSRVNRERLDNYKIVHPLEFTYVPTTDTWKVLAFAVNYGQEDIVVSPIYEVFSVNQSKILSPYLALWLSRKEFDRYARCHSWGSARENFDWDEMCDVEIPIPPLPVQQGIVNIYKAYRLRRDINERLKAQLRDICPILVRGAMEEAEGKEA